LFSIAVNTASSITKTAGTVGYPAAIPLIALAIAEGAAQAAIVSSQPIPKFKKGTKSVPGHDTGDDSVLAMIRPGEGILPTEKNRMYAPSFAAMYDGTVPPEALNRFVLDYQRLKGSIPHEGAGTTYGLDELKQINKTLRGIKTANIQFDKNGFSTYLTGQNSKTEFKNNYFRN